jgi:3-oxoacyl-[acyl-carrier protein] reductase
MPRQSLGITTSLTDDDWLRFWGVNVHTVFYCIREALKIMEPKKYGTIINIASVGGISVMTGHSPGYSASKAAVVSLTKTVALDVSGANIFVNCIDPGGIRTADYDGTWNELVPRRWMNSFSLFPWVVSANPANMPLAAHLASDETYLTGQIISPNGGAV